MEKLESAHIPRRFAPEARHTHALRPVAVPGRVALRGALATEPLHQAHIQAQHHSLLAPHRPTRMSVSPMGWFRVLELVFFISPGLHWGFECLEIAYSLEKIVSPGLFLKIPL